MSSLLLLAACGVWLNPGGSGGSPSLVVSEDPIEWADAAWGVAETASLEIANEGVAPLAIEASVEGDAAFALVEAPAEIAAGEVGTVELSFTAAAYLARSAELVLVSDDPRHRRTVVRLRGWASPDQDGDGHEALEVGGTDCDDEDAGIHGGAAEVCDGIDQDCDGRVDEGASDAPQWHYDLDGDGFGDPDHGDRACEPPAGQVADASDCDDLDAERHPDADETCDLEDDDCDGEIDEDAVDAPTWYADADRDGAGDPATAARSCERPAGAVRVAGDCDDADPTVHEGAPEECDGDDDDCDGEIDEGCG